MVCCRPCLTLSHPRRAGAWRRSCAGCKPTPWVNKNDRKPICDATGNGVPPSSSSSSVLASAPYSKRTCGSSTGRACNARCNGVDPTLPWAVALAAAPRHRKAELSPMLPGSYSLRCLPHSSHNSNVINWTLHTPTPHSLSYSPHGLGHRVPLRQHSNLQPLQFTLM